MTDWDRLLSWLAEVPRENGSHALHQTAAFLVDCLRDGGLEAELLPFTAQPYALRLAGVVILAGSLAYLRLSLARRWGAALAVAVALPAVLLAQLELYLPVFGWLGGQTEHHVLLRLPAEDPDQRLVIAAHYDSKTDLLDHVQRAPVDLLAVPVTLLLVLGALAGWRAERRPLPSRLLTGTARAAGWAAVLYGGASFAALTAGAFVPHRSPGALDNGGADAILVRVAEELAASGPLERTDVELLWLAAEEVGVQGSWRYAEERFDAPPPLSTFVLNLEGLGASMDLGVLGRERFVLRSYAPDPGLVALLDRVLEREEGRRLRVTSYGGATDARSFLAHGVPAATLLSREDGASLMRGLHSAADARSRLDPAALDGTVDYLVAVAREFDRVPPVTSDLPPADALTRETAPDAG